MNLVRHLLPLVAVCLSVAALAQQSSDTPGWQTAAGGKMTFDVASVNPIARELQHRSNFPLDNRDAFVPGGRISATFQLWVYIKFAYKLSVDEGRTAQARLPSWVNNSSDLFAIDARAEGNPTKDQMRLMMQSLLSERFKLAVHFETREVPVLALTLVKPGQPGPKLRRHSEGPPCPAYGSPLPQSDVFPSVCDTLPLELNGLHERLGSRNTTMALIADAISMSHDVDQMVVDRTGLAGMFDFTLDYTAEDPGAPNGALPDPQGSSFGIALRDQLGVKLVPSKAPVRMIVIDHVERASEN